jgi:hypothetical protein
MGRTSWTPSSRLDPAAASTRDAFTRPILRACAADRSGPWTSLMAPPLRAVSSTPVDLHALRSSGRRRDL